MIGTTVSHYRIISKLGGGGMGVVYEAEDLSLERHVALKFLPDDLVTTKEALERFKREAKSASALNHPNICTIHEIGEHEGRPFIAMELMEGKTLKHIISGKPIEIDKVIDLSLEISDALDAAHAKGIIHRDIKPANIFVTDRGHAKLLDFGLAKQTEKDTSGDTDLPTGSMQEHLTKSGSTMGTVAYMSPEQARGKDLDPRTDLFSFGIVLYEMTTGKMPFTGQNTAEVLEAIFTKQPVAPVRLNPDVPAELERIINKALEKDPKLRYQHASDLGTDLQRLRRETSGIKSTATVSSQPTAEPVASQIHPVKTGRKIWFGIVAAIAAIAIIAGLLIARKSKAPLRTSTPSIAVLPFVNMSSDKEQEYFSDGLAEQLLNDLAKTPGLRVIARTSSFQFKGKNEDLRVIGEKLGVANVLEGSVRKEGNKVRITAQLIQASDGSHLWSDTYDRELNDVFAVQDDIAKSVAGALKVTLLGEKTNSAKTENTEAYTAYLQGRYFFERRSKEDLQKATDYFQQALRLDPDYALTWVGLADVHTRQAATGYVPIVEGNNMAEKETEKALQLNPNLAVAHATLGFIKMTYRWDWASARSSLQRALELEPGNALVMRRNAILESSLGRFDEAIELCRKAIQLDPLSVPAYSNLTLIYFNAGRLQEAESTVRKALELNPQFVNAHYKLGVIYLVKSNPQAALAEMQKEPEPVWQRQGFALAYYAAGKKKESEMALADFIEKHQSTGPFQVAEVYAYRGDTDKAFEWLERAYQERDGGLAFMKGDPLLRNIEKDPRYTAFLKKMNLPVN